MKDIALKNAMVLWLTPSLKGTPRVLVIEHPMKERDPMPCSSSDGACWAFWREMTDEERLLYLFCLFTSITCRDKIDPVHAHEAFSVIPEYRQMFTDGFGRKPGI